MFQDEDYDDNLIESNIDDNDEPLDISGENTSHLDIENFIDLNHGMLTNNEILTEEFIEHGDLNFDIDAILNRVDS